MANESLGIGLIGCGNFGRFCLSAYTQAPGIQTVAVADADPKKARSCAKEFNVRACDTVDELLADPAVHAVHIATPPAERAPLACRALEAGKHVFCESPLAIRPEDMDRLIAQAAERSLRLGVNSALRYSPLYHLARRVIESGLAGRLRDLALQNHASDEGLPSDHWFWDPRCSGGILVEHGVHFFDVARWLAGAPGEALAVTVMPRDGQGPVDRAWALARFGAVLAGFYHAFDKPSRLEQTEMRLAFDRGYLTIQGWMPTGADLDVIVDEAGAASLREMVGLDSAPKHVIQYGGWWNARLTGHAGESYSTSCSVEIARYEGDERVCRGAWQEYRVTQRLMVRVRLAQSRETVYRRAVVAAWRDFAASVRDPSHQPLATVADVRASLEMALALESVRRIPEFSV
ncbi:MAG: Gfo/Idh/MocA family oxidoreductase [Anaerolineae bacterium]|nr:Gfo/Idh/MocA family oxidoreductase [Anaerolineae bacterium]MDW8100670.1 Gfo/Idh/MocA family oxidoreductase [Anaerolineae bacterium]